MSLTQQITDEKLRAGILEFLETAPDIYMPGATIDTAIFGFHNDKLKVLLLRFGNSPYFVLPGGYIQKEEHLDDAAMRILRERTGLKNIYLEQFYTSGNATRGKDDLGSKLLQEMIGPISLNNWFSQRFVSVCYYALVDDNKVSPVSVDFFTEVKWFDVGRLPKLMYDHPLIIKKAISRLQSDLDEKLVGFNLMGETFTMNQLQKLYEAVYQKKLVRTNFQRKMLGLGVLERLEKQFNGKSHKAPYLYRFADSK